MARHLSRPKGNLLNKQSFLMKVVATKEGARCDGAEQASKMTQGHTHTNTEIVYLRAQALLPPPHTK